MGGSAVYPEQPMSNKTVAELLIERQEEAAAFTACAYAWPTQSISSI
jgi:hypothetical protein